MEEDEEGKDFKEKIIEKIKELINDDEDLVGNGKSLNFLYFFPIYYLKRKTQKEKLLHKIFKTNYIDKNSIIIIISCLLDYIKESIFTNI